MKTRIQMQGLSEESGWQVAVGSGAYRALPPAGVGAVSWMGAMLPAPTEAGAACGQSQREDRLFGSELSQTGSRWQVAARYPGGMSEITHPARRSWDTQLFKAQLVMIGIPALLPTHCKTW